MSRPASRSVKTRARVASAAASTFHLKLDPRCTLQEAAQLQSRLIAASGNPLVVDGSAVERIDTAGLQLLVALARRQQQAGRALQWQAASPALRSCTARLGLSAALGLAAAGAQDTS